MMIAKVMLDNPKEAGSIKPNITAASNVTAPVLITADKMDKIK